MATTSCVLPAGSRSGSSPPTRQERKTMTVSSVTEECNDVRMKGAPTPPVTARPSGAVQLWALVGALGVALVVSSWLRWIVSDDFQPPSPGPDTYGQLWWLRTVQVLSLLLVVGFFSFFVV